MTGGSLRQRVALSVAAAVGLGVIVGASGTPARAEDPAPESVSMTSRYQVTFAARSCPSYAEIMGNRVRDDRVEAAEVPGRASAYADGQPVEPGVEAAAGGGCAPLTGWRFTFGAGREKKGALSVVTAPAGEAGPTVDAVALLDPAGHASGTSTSTATGAGTSTATGTGTGTATGATLAGAVTVVLSDEQVRLAARRQLWVQGGNPADPLLAKAVPGHQFGVLRCAADGRAGTNTQWLGFPAGVRHAFCFAYYVKTPARPATLVLRARTSRPVGYPQRFAFEATHSYAPDKVVELATAGEPIDTSLVRIAGGAAQRVNARIPSGWQLADSQCTASGAGRSAITIDRAAGRVELSMVAGEVVTCTFTFDPPPPPPGLTLRVWSEVAGAFSLAVDGDGGARALRATPPGDGSSTVAVGADLSGLQPGAYTVTLSPPATEREVWSLTAVTCNGTEVKPDRLSAVVSLAASQPLDCTLRLARRPGSLKLRAATADGLATAAFAVVPLVEGVPGWSAVATTTGYGVPAVAMGDLPPGLSIGAYLITPLAPPSTVDGSWRLAELACQPTQAASVLGGDAARLAGAVVVLDVGTPEVECTASYQLVPASRLQVTLRFAGEPVGRAGPASLEINCADGAHGRVVLSTNDSTDASLPQTLAFLDATRCTVGQPTAGTRDGATVAISAALQPAPGNAPLSLPAAVQIGRDVAEYTVTVTMTFDGTDDPPVQARVLDPFRVLPVALIGGGLVGMGLVMLMVMVVRSRRA